MPTRRSAVVVGALMLATLAACGEGGGDGSQAAVRASAGAAALGGTTTTVTSPAPPAKPGAAPLTVTGATSTTRPNAPTTLTPTTRRAGGPATGAVPAGPRVLVPPAPGTYRYSTAGTTTVAGSTIVFPGITSLAVDSPSGTRQRSIRNLRDGAGNGMATEFTLDYRPNGIYLVGLRITIGFSGTSDTRDLTPANAVLLLPTGARPGAHLEADLAVGAGTARLAVDVLGEESLVIGGQAVNTLVMRAVVTLPPGDVNGRQVLTVNVDPGSRLWVKERGEADASAAAGLVTLHSEYTATLQRLTP